MVHTVLVALLTIWSIVAASGLEAELTLQRIEQTMGFNLAKTNLRVTKFNRTCAVLNGTADLFVDLDNTYTMRNDLAYSRLGNNQFNLHPVKIAEQLFCHYLNGTYREYQTVLEGASNFPQIGPEGLCPFPAGHYWIRNLLFDLNLIQFPAPEGFWRDTIVIDGESAHFEAEIYAKISRDSFW